jgi:uncharacterized delta-60 repeat protein
VVMPNGTIVYPYSSYNPLDGVTYFSLVRYNSNGSPDAIVGLGVSCNPSNTCGLKVIASQSDGKLYATKKFNQVTTLYRINNDSSLDTTFTPLLFNGTNNEVLNKLKVMDNGKIMISGMQGSRVLFRLNSDGTTDSSFESPVITNTLGSPSFRDFILKNDGKVIVTGYFNTINSVRNNAIARLNSNGSVDLTYGPDIQTDFGTGGVYAQKLSNGKYIVQFVSTISSTNRFVRFNSDDTVDSTFSAPPMNLPLYPGFEQFVIDNQDRVVTPAFRLNYNGSLDASYPPAELARPSHVTTLALQSDGKVIVAGDFTKANSAQRAGFARLKTDGSNDSSFNVGSGFTGSGISNLPNVIAVQPDGRILVAGEFRKFNGVDVRKLVRLNSDGSLDESFIVPIIEGPSASVYQFKVVLPLSNGKILIGGDFYVFGETARRYLLRLNSDGTLDSTFNTSVNGIVFSIVLQPDGKLMVGGFFNSINGAARTGVARLNSDGTVDARFNTGLSVLSALKIIQQSDGKYLIYTNSSLTSLRRVNSDGSADTSFVSPSVTEIYQIYVQPDGMIVIAGNFRSINGTPRGYLARLKNDGSLDGFYLREGANASIYALVAQPDGKLLVGGYFSTIGGVVRTGGLARLNNIPFTPLKTLFDFDGDGKADVSVYRASTNTWYRFLSGNSIVQQTTFGISGDIPVPEDYDNDRKTDIAIFRPTSGDWWYLSSINGTPVYNHWGQNGDIPLPSDFDGDGKSDFVLYRPTENNWYLYGSTGQVTTKNFGSAGDKPVIGDFDGDAKSDLAIFRPSTGDWWYQSSINNIQYAVHFGISTDIPSPADFDGDGKTDFAVYRASTGVWYILNSSNGSATIVKFGISEDKPVAADYDGDGKADIAVYRPSTGIWYLLQSTSGFSAFQFGISSDIPVPNSFVP